MKKFFLGAVLIFLVIFSFRAFLPIKIQEIFKKNRQIVEKKLFEDDYSKVFDRAKKENKAIAFYFTSGCHFCKKMKEEILNSEEFKKNIEDDFIIFIVKKEEDHYLKLQKKYLISDTPAFVFVTAEEERMAELGYLPIDGKSYAKKMKKVLFYIKKFVSVNKGVSSKELFKLYLKAKKFKSFEFEKKIFSLGIEKEALPFLFEKYQRLLGEKKVEEAAVLRKKIIFLDPMNIHKIHLKLALLDFRYSVEQNLNPNEAIAPLLCYLGEFGTKDKENHFRIEMMMVEFFQSLQLNDEALKHAREAYKYAPNPAKKELFLLISNLKKESLKISKN